MTEVIQRLNRERGALEAKTDKLCRFIGSPRFQEVGVVQRELLAAQYHAMKSYLTILNFRIDHLIGSSADEQSGGPQ